MTLMDLKKALFKFAPVRFAVGLFFLGRGLVLMPFAPYAGITSLCWVYRVSGISALRAIAYRVITGYVFGKGALDGRLMQAFLQSNASTKAASRIINREAPFDSMFRDIMVMKAPTAGEKGVIVLEYTARFDLFVSLFDFDRIIRDYYIVLEPCWAGYCDPSILMFITKKCDIIVQAPERTDFDFIAGLQSNLKPVNLGSSDWIDPDLFAPAPEGTVKEYDLVMVANWAKHKNHRKLFEALQRVKHRPVSLLLIGVDWGGRTSKDILDEMRSFDLPHVKLEIKANIPAREVAAHLARSKVFLLLTEKEGSNRAIVEALFSGAPAILYEHFVGGAKGKINEQTGVLASFEGLAERIDEMLDRHEQFTPRAWALQNTGAQNATAKLNALLKSLAEARGETWNVGIVEKVNNPNFNYKVPGSLLPEQQASGIARAYLRDEMRAKVGEN